MCMYTYTHVYVYIRTYIYIHESWNEQRDTECFYLHCVEEGRFYNVRTVSLSASTRGDPGSSVTIDPIWASPNRCVLRIRMDERAEGRDLGMISLSRQVVHVPGGGEPKRLEGREGREALQRVDGGPPPNQTKQSETDQKSTQHLMCTVRSLKEEIRKLIVHWHRFVDRGERDEFTNFPLKVKSCRFRIPFKRISKPWGFFVTPYREVCEGRRRVHGEEWQQSDFRGRLLLTENYLRKQSLGCSRGTDLVLLFRSQWRSLG